MLINNAGFSRGGGGIFDEPEADIRRTFDVNILAHFWTVREFVPDMVRRGHGHVVTVASMSSFITAGKMVDYACTKAAALAFHEGLTQELKHWTTSNVRTSIIHPTWVRTPMIDVLTRAGNEFKQRVLTPDDVSKAVVHQVVSQTSAQVILPSSHVGLVLLRALPTWLQELVRSALSKEFIRLRKLMMD